ncbi:TlpA disulfide reductase family protein [Sphingobacterium faecale]|uniref:AhpC/TSA family protein n=1 Tax=Sphingobacterium faecale TaxID=2803775 RepID=A0ABS1QXP2_9SPHI|nr:TlpA disulfide reductase family protein [Sphingobacterium faecale]MBL1407181.1 AhpC/TSA family protein [Sphingobacterium faecale]
MNRAIKTNILTVVFLLLLGGNIALGQVINFTVQGKTDKSNDGRYIKLYYEKDTLKIIDSVSIKKGNFQFKGKLPAPTLGKLSFESEDMGDRIDLFLSKGTVRVVAKDSLYYANISGAKLAEDHERFAAKVRPVDREFIDALNVFKAMPEGDAKKAYITQVLGRLDEYTRFKREAAQQFVVENPNSYVALYHLEKTASPGLANYETTFPFYEKLSPALKATALGEQLGERLLAVKGNLTGKEYIDFVSTTPKGDELSLKEVLKSNKYTLVDFWASWCGPCRKENPHVVETYEAFNSKGFTVLSVSLDDDKGRWEEAIRQDNMPWYHVSSLKGWKEPAAQLYGIRAIPQNFLIDASGKIVASNLRGETLFKKVEQLLK